MNSQREYPKLKKAQEFASKGDWMSSRKIFHQLSKKFTTDWKLFYQIGLIEAKGGNYVRAVVSLEQAHRLLPIEPQINANLAQLYSLVDKPEKALPILENLAVTNPNSLPVFIQLGGVCQNLGLFEKAEKAFKRSLQLGAKDPSVFNNYAVMLQEIGRNSEAVAFLEQALKLSPKNTEIINNLANLYISFNWTDNALQVFLDGLKLDPLHFSLNRNLALLKRNLGDVTEATSFARRTCISDPQRMDGLIILTELYEHRADLQSAIRWAHWAITGDLDNMDSITLFARILRRAGKPLEAITLLDDTCDRLGQIQNSHKLHFEAGQIQQTLGLYPEAFGRFETANKLQHLNLEKRTVDPRRPFDRLAELGSILNLAVPLCAKEKPLDDVRTNPVFLVGFPRSGTTLLDQILDSHKSINVLEERPLVAGMIRRMVTNGYSYPQGIPSLDKEIIQTLRDGYFSDRDQYISLPDDNTFIDKMPLNINDAILIKIVFPKARFLLALRDPCDVCLSCFIQAFELNDWMAVFDTVDSAARLYCEVFDLWEKTVDKLDLDIHAIRYEDLVNDLEGTARRFLDYLSLPWDDGLLTFYKHAQKRGHLRTPSHAQVTQPVYLNSLNRWKRYGPLMNTAEKILRSHRQRLGYYKEPTE